MPHVHDKAAFAECRELLGLPSQVLSQRAHNGRLVLDTDQPGQQAFQAMLWDCFFSRDMDHPWDRNGGRSFRDLILYFSYIAPRLDRLLISTNTAGRVASYLLPYTRIFPDGSYEHYGIPGLRVAQINKRTLLLRHLPTQGMLVLQDTSFSMATRTMRYLLNDEVETSRRVETGNARQPVWRQKRLTPEEEAASSHWAPSPCTALRSALMARSYLWWHSHAVLLPPRRSNATRCLRWSSSHTCAQIGELLTDSGVRIPRATYSRRRDEYDLGVLRLGEGAIEFDGPLDSQDPIRDRSASRNPRVGRRA